MSDEASSAAASGREEELDQAGMRPLCCQCARDSEGLVWLCIIASVDHWNTAFDLSVRNASDHCIKWRILNYVVVKSVELA